MDTYHLRGIIVCIVFFFLSGNQKMKQSKKKEDVLKVFLQLAAHCCMSQSQIVSLQTQLSMQFRTVVATKTPETCRPLDALPPRQV